MKILHCADLHLDSKLTANLDKLRAKERKAEILRTFERMVGYAKENEIFTILICGDLFDTKNVSTTACNVVLNAILQNPDITFFYLKGNHDTDSFVSKIEEIPDNLKLFNEEWTSYNIGDIVITGAELCKANSANIHNSLIVDYNKFNIVMLHGQETESASKDDAEVINLKVFRNKGIDYLALGHIHSYKCEKLDNRAMYCYPGCLEGRGFDECGEHGFVVIDIDEDTKTFTYNFVPFTYRNLYTVSADISDCLSTPDVTKAVKNSLDDFECESKDMIKIVLQGNVDVECEINTEYIVKFFENEYYFVKVYDETSVHIDIEEYKLDQSLKGEFVRTVFADSDTSDEDKMAIIHYGLKVINGEEIE